MGVHREVSGHQGLLGEKKGNQNRVYFCILSGASRPCPAPQSWTLRSGGGRQSTPPHSSNPSNLSNPWSRTDRHPNLCNPWNCGEKRGKCRKIWRRSNLKQTNWPNLFENKSTSWVCAVFRTDDFVLWHAFLPWKKLLLPFLNTEKYCFFVAHLLVWCMAYGEAQI